MKKSIYLLLLFAGIINAQQKHLSISGKITNKSSDSLFVYNDSYKKVIILKKDGTFSDILKVKPGSYLLYYGESLKDLYLKNGYALKITVDAKDFDKTLLYSGKGAEVNNYLAQVIQLDNKLVEDASLFDLNDKEFAKKLEEIKGKYNTLLKTTKNMDEAFVKEQSKMADVMIENLKFTYADKAFIKKSLAPGMDLPKFSNYKDYKGGTLSLDDLKGKYVYIDLWATWCGPCKAEIPYLKAVEKKYHDKNIEFVSISVDEVKDHEKWKAMVKDMELTGTQLITENGFESLFTKACKIESIPRFMLIDPQGKIISAQAPSPSDEQLTKLFEGLKI